MGKKNLLIVMLFLFLIFPVTAESFPQRQDGQLDQQYIISQPCASCSYINISVLTKDGIVLDNVPMVQNGSTWIYNFTPTSTLRHDVNGVGDINGLDDSFAFWFDVTLSGEQASSTSIFANLILILFISGLIFGLSSLHKKINFESWYNNLTKKYSDSNVLKTTMAGAAYTFLKDIWVVYYLLGIPILLLLVNVCFVYNIESIYYILTIVSRIYTVGMVLVGLVFLFDMVEILKGMWDNIANNKWGIE